MKRSLQVLRSAYRLLLNLYPRDFLAEFREELQTVFNLSLLDAVNTGNREVAVVILRELIGLPKAVIHEYLRHRRKTKMLGTFTAKFDFRPGSTPEALAATTPLLLTIIATSGISMLLATTPIFSGLPASAFGYLLTGLFFFLLLVGLVKGIPRWSMPYLGMLLAFYSIGGFSEFIYQYYGFYYIYERSWLLGVLTDQMYMWSGLIVVMILLIMASALLPPFRRFRRDWTLLCFLAYGAAPFAVLISYDEYQRNQPYMLLALLLQALGVWSYLRTSRKWKRYLVLFGALTLSLWIAGAGKAILLPIQPWFDGDAVDLWKHEMLSALITWAWLAVGMLLPSVIHFFPKLRKPVPAT